eukprot:scaffold148721_cov28-Tisochrysis_lutea.AAC.2
MAVGRVVASAGATAAPSALLARRVASGGWWSDAQQSAVALELDRLYSRALALRSPRYSRSLSAQGNSVPSGKPVAWETADGRSGSSAASAWTTIVRSGGISGHATLSAWARLGWLTASQLPKAAHEFDEVQGTGEEVSTEMGGVYIHGPVGSGKTALMNLLIEACHAADVPIRRLHFHQACPTHGPECCWWENLHRLGHASRVWAGLADSVYASRVDRIASFDHHS